MAPPGQSIRPAHPSGPTFLTYTPNGRKLITVGSNNTIRVFETGSDNEPINIDDSRELFTAVVATNDCFITGSEDGSVCKFSLHSHELEEILVRCSLPIRSLALSPDKQWVAVASDELVIKVVYLEDMTRVRYIRDLPKPCKHITFDFNGDYLMASCADGIVYVYDMTSAEPSLLRKIEDLIPRLENDAQQSSAVVWHPDGRAFAAPVVTRDIQVMSKRDWEKQRAFRDGHSGDITALSWSPNGALLVSAAADKKLCLWDTKSQRILHSLDNLRSAIWAFSWHPTDNILSYTNDEGELFIHSDFVPTQHASLLEQGLQPAPFIHDPLAPVSGNIGRQPNARSKDAPQQRVTRQGTPDSLDEILGPEDASDLEGFVEDDDGEGYAEAPAVNGHGKRPNGESDHYAAHSKRRALWQPQVHESFQPGSTPWRGNRRYLCLNLIGFVWTIDQDTHHTVTVEFYDREFQRDFHFTDPFGYDKACLTQKGVLFSSQPKADGTPAMLTYRRHEAWTTRADWRWPLPAGEEITSIALSDSYVVATTSNNYVRIYTLFGTPIRVSRHKSAPIVTCATYRDYVMTIGNGSVGADGQSRLTYSIENIKREELLQNEDTVAVPWGEAVSSVFFSDRGDPFVYDTTGTLLALLRWRTPGAATWTPLLDTTSLGRLAGGKKQESYFPIAVADGRFHCIILKGGDRYPYFPRPLLSEFDFEVPIFTEKAKGASGVVDGPSETQRLESKHILSRTLCSLAQPPPEVQLSHQARNDLARQEVETDKALLQLLAAECVEGEHAGMKCLEIVGLMRGRGGKMLDAAAKVAGRFGREALRDKIRELEERRLVGLDGDDEMDV